MIASWWDIIMTGVLRGGIYILTSVGLSLVFGVMNIPNFAHGEFYMLGAFLAFFGYTIFGLIITIIAAARGTFLIGIAIEKGVFVPLRKKTKEEWVMNSFLVTIGLSIAIVNIAQALWGANFRGIPYYWEGSISILSGISISFDRFVGFIIALLTVSGFWLFLNKTKLGMSIRCVSQNEVGAMLIGIDRGKIHSLTFGLSCMLAGIAGAILLSITPAYPSMGVAPLYKSWFVVILVGLGNVGGTIAGGLIVGMLEAFSYYFLGAGWQDVVSLSVIILILLIKPAGIFGKSVKGVWGK
jgi:branched-chain amino acid transport system permease protein